MKNIVYLVKSTRKVLCPEPRVVVSQTNYLYRQLLLHNHLWNPADKARRRVPTRETLFKWGWKPVAVITGFPTESHASKFKDLFQKQYAGLLPLKCIKDRRYRYDLDQIEYRAKQLSFVAKDFMDSVSEERVRAITEQKDEGAQAVKGLTIHWDDIGLIEKYGLKFPIDFHHVQGVDVSAIDEKNFDPLDEDDDRNFERLKTEKYERDRRAKMVKIANELKIPLDQIQDVLHKSRQEAYLRLTDRKGKTGKKAQKYITLFPKPPKPLDLSKDAFAAEKMEA